MQGLIQPKIKNILVVILMILSSTLSGCVTDNGPPTIEEENESNNDMEDETSNNILEKTYVSRQLDHTRFREENTVFFCHKTHLKR